MNAPVNHDVLTAVSNRHLDALEEETIFILREVAAAFERPALLFSGGKDSLVMLKCAEKAFGVGRLPLSISEHAIFAGTQDDAFARSYALINPTFEVNSFTGYCDPTAVFGDIEPNAEFTQERIDGLREYEKALPFTQALSRAYTLAGNSTEEAVFFIEQVTGHLIPDFKPALAKGITGLIAEIDTKIGSATPAKRSYYEAMKVSLESIVLLAERYAELAREQQATATGQRKAALAVLEATLRHVPRNPARLRMPPDNCEGSLSSASAGNPASLILSRASS